MGTGPLADVTLEREGDRWTLTFARDLPYPPEEVWRLLTDPAVLPEWAPFTADRDLGATGPATLTMTDGSDAPHLPADVTVAAKPWMLEHTWGHDVLRWEVGQGTADAAAHPRRPGGVAGRRGGLAPLPRRGRPPARRRPGGADRREAGARPRLGGAARRLRRAAHGVMTILLHSSCLSRKVR